LDFLLIFMTFIALSLVPGFFCWLVIKPESAFTESVVFGAILGIVFLAFGSLLSMWTHIFLIRYLPSVLFSMIGIFYFLRGSRVLPKFNQSDFYIISGGLVGIALGLKQLLLTLDTQPILWNGWWSFYGDLPFHVALTSEVISRAPEVFPYLPSQAITYTWMFHGAMGVWGSLAGASADIMVLQVWPILFHLLLPFSVAVFAFALTKSKLVSLVSPALTIIFTGPIGFQNNYVSYEAFFQISPTHELGILFLFLIILLTVIVFQFSINLKLKSLFIIGLYFISCLVAVGTKGTIWLYLFIIVSSLFVGRLLTRSLNRDSIMAAGISGLATLVSLKIVINTRGGLQVEPFSVLIGEDPFPMTSAIIALILLAFWMVGIAIAVTQFTNYQNALLVPSFATVTVGILGAFLFGHGGKSQVYFYWGVVPILIILVVYSLVLIANQYDLWLITVLGISGFVFFQNVLKIDQSPETYSLMLVLSLLFSSILVYLYLKFSKRSFNKLITGSIAAVLVCTFFFQSFEIPRSHWSFAAADGTGNNINYAQIKSLKELKRISDPDDVIISNRVCTNLILDELYQCDIRYWFASGYSERRVIFETQGYIMGGDALSTENYERFELTRQLVISPSTSVAMRAKEMGAKWIYIDKSRAFANTYAEVARLIYESKSNQIWELK